MTGILSKLNIPNGVYFSNNNLWVRKNIYGLIKVGINELALIQNKNLIIDKIVEIETTVKKGDFIFKAVSEKGITQYYSPINGLIKFINPNLQRKKIRDPYENDWIIIMLAENFTKDKCSLFSVENFKKINSQYFNRS